MCCSRPVRLPPCQGLRCLAGARWCRSPALKAPVPLSCQRHTHLQQQRPWVCRCAPCPPAQQRVPGGKPRELTSLRSGHWRAVGVDMATVDCAGVYVALGVEGELTLHNVLLRGIAPASAARVNTRTQFQLSHCDLWPSFVVLPGAQARPNPQDCLDPQAGSLKVVPGSAAGDS